MSVEKNSFILYFGYRKHLALLNDEDRGKLIMAIFDYAEDGKIPSFDGATAMAFSFIQDQMDRDAEKYAAKCAKNQENGSKGGRPPKPKESENNPKKPNGYFGNPEKHDNDSGNDSVSDIDLSSPPTPSKGGSPARGADLTAIEKRFELFWTAYPKKVGRAVALKAWKRVRPADELHEKILRAVSVQKDSDQWRRENGRFIPNPATWLNQGRWDDETEAAEKRGFKYNDYFREGESL